MKNNIPTVKETALGIAKKMITHDQDVADQYNGDNDQSDPIIEAIEGHKGESTDDEYDQLYFEVEKQYERMVALRTLEKVKTYLENAVII